MGLFSWFGVLVEETVVGKFRVPIAKFPKNYPLQAESHKVPDTLSSFLTLRVNTRRFTALVAEEEKPIRTFSQDSGY